IYREWLLSSLASYPDSSISSNIELILDGYDVVEKGEFPPQSRLVAGAAEGYDVVMMTGSKHTAHDSSIPFIKPLVDFISGVAHNPATQHVRIVGVCFGHQIISLAMGGQVVAGQNGWEIGVYGNDVTEEGRYWWCGDVKGEGGGEKVFIEQMHRDHVPSLPPGFHLLLSTPNYPVHSMIRYHPASTSSNPLAQILTVQGHPEFTPSIVSKMVDFRSQQGIFDPPTAQEARRRLGGKDGSGGEGFGRVGWAIWRVLLQDLP
ncbi:class I glutamine amidotransferase-like protein, partial [Naematelia encephala]